MNPLILEKIARRVVEQALSQLPTAIRAAAENCLLTFETGGEEELLGLFEGASLLDGPPRDPLETPKIRLYLDEIWLEAEGIERLFQKEVKLTFLHELGHYLGWDEDEVDAAGLG